MKVPIRRIGILTESDVDVWRSDWSSTKVERVDHQRRESARRRRQILAGTLSRANGFVGGIEALAQARAAETPKVLLLKEQPNLWARLTRRKAA